MIRAEKYTNALISLWAILQQAHQVAIEHRDYQLMKILDIATRMPYLIGSEQEDNTQKFRESIDELVRDNPDFRFILNIFDSTSPRWTPE